MKITYNGHVTIGSYGEADDILKFAGTDTQDNHYDNCPLAKIIMEDIESHGNYLSVRYFTNTEKPIDPRTVEENFIKTIMGAGDVKYADHYSEYTGYLWTDNELNIGGHNLLNELETQVPVHTTTPWRVWGDLYLYLEIEYNKEAKDAQV